MDNKFYFNGVENGYIFGNNELELTLEKVGGKVFLKNLKNKKTGYRCFALYPNNISLYIQL